MNDHDIDRLIGLTKDIIESKEPNRLQMICEMLKEQVHHYDWVGFYLVDDLDERMLVLGPFSGEATEHVRITFGRGICGQAAETGKLLLIQDVTAEDNYLSCGANVRSEIVLPVYSRGRIVGELDIDSYQYSPFDNNDTKLLEKICTMVAELL